MLTEAADEMVVNRASIATALFNYHVGSRQNTVAKNLHPQGCEIWPIAGWQRGCLWNDAGYHFVALAKLYSLARAQPSLQPFGVTKLANIDARHL